MHVKRKDKVRLTEEEWDELSDKVWVMRSNDPTASIIKLANRAMEQFPKDRQRSFITTKDVEQITERIYRRDQQAKDDAVSLVRVRQQLDDAKRQLDERQTAEELLTDITDTEMMRLFKERVLVHITVEDLLQHFDTHSLCIRLAERMPTSVLVGIAAQRFTTELIGEQQPQAPTESNGRVSQVAPKTIKTLRKPKIVIAGLQKKQVSDLSKLAPGVEIVAIEGQAPQSSIPQSADLYISWTKFMRHSSDHNMRVIAGASRFARCSGGMTDLASIIKSRFSKN